MASIKELDDTIPAYFTLSNKRLIVMARVSEETVFFYDNLDRNTTIILLAQPDCYTLKHLFLKLMADIGVTVVDLQEKESFDPQYMISPRSGTIISNLISNYKYDLIITHPKYNRNNDPQNRALYDLVTLLEKELGLNNHYTYNMIKYPASAKTPRKVKRGILELYCRVGNKNNVLDEDKFQNYVNISSRVNGLKKI